MKNRKLDEYMKQNADRDIKQQAELERNPLLQYSTSELKAELRRRNRGD